MVIGKPPYGPACSKVCVSTRRCWSLIGLGSTAALQSCNNVIEAFASCNHKVAAGWNLGHKRLMLQRLQTMHISSSHVLTVDMP